MFVGFPFFSFPNDIDIVKGVCKILFELFKARFSGLVVVVDGCKSPFCSD